jgi:hypothetical protein
MNNEPASSTQFASHRSWLLCLIAALTLTAAWAGRAADNTAAPLTSQPPKKTPKPDASAIWKDRDVLVEGTVEFRNAPVTDIARTLSQQFSNKLDVLVPDSQDFLDSPFKYTVSLRLRDATAAELFNAMNRIFEAGMTPLHWELTMNGDRPTAVLKVEQQTESRGTPTPQGQQAIGRTVMYVGDLVGAKKPSVAMKEIAKKLMEVHALAYEHEKRDLVQCYAEGELIIVTGTPDEIRFVRDTVERLRCWPVAGSCGADAGGVSPLAASRWPQSACWRRWGFTR